MTTTQLDWFSLQRRLAAGDPVVLGVGSYEQHGPHLPMTTDALIADALVDRVSSEIGGVALPTLGYGAPSRPRSGGGDAFPAPAVSLMTLMATVAEVAQGALDAGAKRLVVISWHFENAAVLWDALRNPLQGGAAKALLFDGPWDYLDAESARRLFGDAEPAWAADHAGLLETAVMRHLRPDLVGDSPPTEPHRRRDAYDVLPTPADAVPSTGVVNDARGVTAEDGERCLGAIVGGIVAAVRDEA